MTYTADGNVIHHNFRKPLTFTISAKTEILYRDDLIIIIRVTPLCDGKPMSEPFHFAGHFTTGIVQPI